LNASERPQRWCGECAKCTFVALILAPQLSEAEQAAIFGQVILTHESNKSHLNALLGLSDVKPWDCVGTARECWLSLLKLRQQGRLPESLHPLADQAPPEFKGPGLDQMWAEEWALQPSPLLSDAWQKRLHAYLNAH
jgi:hypothetical protein